MCSDFGRSIIVQLPNSLVFGQFWASEIQTFPAFQFGPIRPKTEQNTDRFQNRFGTVFVVFLSWIFRYETGLELVLFCFRTFCPICPQIHRICRLSEQNFRKPVSFSFRTFCPICPQIRHNRLLGFQTYYWYFLVLNVRKLNNSKSEHLNFGALLYYSIN